MQLNNAPSTPRQSLFVERLSHHATMVASTRDRYATDTHVHDCDMLFVPLAGRFSVGDAQGEAQRLGPGHFVWFAAGSAHSTTTLTSGQTHIAVYVDPALWATALQAQGVSGPPQGMRAGSTALRALSQRMFESAKTGAGENYALCGALVMEAARLSGNPLSDGDPSSALLVAELLAEAIESDLAEPLSLEAFAQQHRLSRRQVERIFRAKYGVSPLAWLQRRRLERAAYLLAHTRESVLSIALQVGWESGSYLSRMLEKTWAKTATQIRASGPGSSLYSVIPPST
ncbi:AraC family transcriptional regulator [Variovorax sp. OV084]|jgi:AraC-like DNA-binding protein|uniref:AraC family transcriptional regulator n=1 Tax=Variovorax sp. OV084 TaxID=1882777 RepID=UPI0008BAE994|nr:AraC family transcriptional regulator [Variovorax sp. OV084]SET70038.1 Helix-turn-helix domain-containing protein [Variovorax sp. OV084]